MPPGRWGSVSGLQAESKQVELDFDPGRTWTGSWNLGLFPRMDQQQQRRPGQGTVQVPESITSRFLSLSLTGIEVALKARA